MKKNKFLSVLSLIALITAAMLTVSCGGSDDDDSIGEAKRGDYGNRETDGSVYDLCGRQIMKDKSLSRELPRGIYIEQGKKILME